MTHASWNNERGRPSGPGHDNERLEYLGDAVLELVVGEYLFRRFPEYDEGQLTQLRAALVNTVTLARLAERLHLGEALYVGKGAAKTGARQLPSLLANSFEALIGAIFLDQGYRVATRVFLQNIGDLAEWSDENFKGKLQEAAQERTGTTPNYRVTAGSGPGHKREYTAEAIVGGEVVGTGRGGTKQAAEQASARAALETLGKRPKKRAPRAAAGTAPVRAARSARDAGRATAGEPPRVRRRVAEVAADRSVAGRRSERDAVPPLLAEHAGEGPQKRRRGLLGAIRSAAEALVGRVAPVEPEAAPPPPPPLPPPPAPRQRSRGGGEASSSGRNAASSRRGNGAPAGFSGVASKPAGGRPPASTRRRAQAQDQNPPAEPPPREGGRRQAGGGTTTPRAQRPPASAEGEETRRPSRRGRRGGRGRRRPGTAPETPES
jgi:ribonuclease-3